MLGWDDSELFYTCVHNPIVYICAYLSMKKYLTFQSVDFDRTL
jgi:hypothetical protein